MVLTMSCDGITRKGVRGGPNPPLHASLALASTSDQCIGVQFIHCREKNAMNTGRVCILTSEHKNLFQIFPT